MMDFPNTPSFGQVYNASGILYVWDGVAWNLLPSALAIVTTGSMDFFPGNVAPVGYLKINGALYSRATYAALWAYAQASGNLAASDGAWTEGQFSPGDGSTTFRIPDARGNFFRALDDSRGIDTGRVIGSSQADDIKSHSHTQQGSFQSGDRSAAHVHGLPAYLWSNRSGSNFVPGNASSTYWNQNVGGLTTDGENVGHSHNTTISGQTAASGGTETRVRNIAWLACIKY